MPTDLMVLPDSFPDPEWRASAAVADLDADGHPELVLFMVQNPPEQNTAHYRVGRDLDDEGKVTGGWSPWLAVPDWFSWEDEGAAVAVADLAGDGQQDLFVFMVDCPPGQNNGLYRVGRSLDGQGNVTEGWSPWMQIPDWFSSENLSAGISIADLSGNGHQDLVVFMVDKPAGPVQGFYRIGRDLDRDGAVQGGWSPWLAVPDWMSWPSQSAGIAVADVTGVEGQDLTIFLLGNPKEGKHSYYRVGRGLDREGALKDGWGDWIVLTDPHAGEHELLGTTSASLGSRTQMVVFRADPASRRIYVSSTDPNPRRDQVEWVSDAPAREDMLRRQPLAQELATRLRRFHDQDPGTSFLIHIDGPWGTGKSTLLNLLKQELEQGEEPMWLTVTFNAWRQSRVGTPWWALLAALRYDLGRLYRLPARASQFTRSVVTPGRPLGYLFLDKLFQLHVPLPTIDAAKQQEYLKDILRVRDPPQGVSEAEEQAVRDQLLRSSSEAEVVEALRNASTRVRGRVAGAAVEILSTPAVAATTEHHLQRFGPLLEPNPRAMKRFVNDYGMLRAVRTLEGNPVSTDPLALWAIIQTRWPALADCLRARPESIGLLGGSDSCLQDVPADLHGLFNDANVSMLVNFEYGGPLTPELIRACCGAVPQE
jgi:hypothetical protein